MVVHPFFIVVIECDEDCKGYIYGDSDDDDIDNDRDYSYCR